MRIIIVFTIIFLLSIGVLGGCIFSNKENTSLSIDTFRVIPSVIMKGGTAIIIWNVTGATSLTIDNGIGNVGAVGSREIKPNVTTIYTLTVSNGTSTREAEVQITVTTALENTSAVSGRILSDLYLLNPIYNASVVIDGKPAEIYGTTYLALNVSVGKVMVKGYDNSGQSVNETVAVEPLIVSSADLIFPANAEGTPPEVTTSSTSLRLSWENGMSINLNLNGDEIQGIGEVTMNGIPLRKNTSAAQLTIEKIKNDAFVNIPYEKWRFINYETKGKVAVIHSELTTSDGNVKVDWIFTPWEISVENIHYVGFGYRFSISSPMNISTLGFSCSWELNANIVGKTLLTRRQATDWERVCTKSDGFNIKTNYLLGQSQPPDYQFDDSGALASYIWPPGEVGNTLQKDNGADQLWFSDEYSFGETTQAETPFRVILYAEPSGIDEYTYLFDQISQNYRDFYGIQEVEPLPTVLTRNYLQAQPGDPYPYENVTNNILPEFATHNFKHVNILSVWTSNGRIGSPYDGNRLATQSIDVYPDDVNSLIYFINKTHALGMKLSVWLSMCYSKDSPFIPVDEWKTVDVNGKIPSPPSQDTYVMSYRSGYLSYALEQLPIIMNDFGFNGIWHDSFTQGLSIDYSNNRFQPPIDQQMQFVSATQRMGYSPFLESIGPFGLTAVGSVQVTPPSSPHGERDMNAAFGGKEYLAYKTAFTLWHVDDYHPMQINYYKFLANKACPMINYAYLSATEKDNVSQANKDFNAVSSYMDIRHVLSNDNGIIWFNNEDNTQVLFAFKAFSYDISENMHQVYGVTSNSNMEIMNGSITTEPYHTYRIQ
jgi:hypothetical protein